MAFLDELGKVISDKSREAAEKVKDLTGVIQLKTKLSAEREKVNKAYMNLGKAYYDRHDAAAEEEYAGDFETVRLGLVKMAELEDEILELEGSRICAECGARVEKNALYCSKCGAPMAEKTAGASESGEAAESSKEKEEDIFEEADSEEEE